MNFQNISARATCSQIAKVHVFCFTVFWVTHLLISGLQNLETFSVSSPALSLLKHSFDIWTNWEWLTCKTCSWWRHSIKKLVSWSPSTHLDVALLQTLQKNCSFLPTRAYQSASTKIGGRWLPTTCPLPFCHFARWCRWSISDQTAYCPTTTFLLACKSKVPLKQ